MNTRLIAVVVLLVVLGSYAYAADASNGVRAMRVLAQLPASQRGWNLAWADGLTCTALTANKYALISDQGSVDLKSIPYDFGAPLCAYSDQPTLFYRFGRGAARWRSFLGALDTRTGNVSYIMEHRTKALWDEPPIYYCHGRFWSPDLQRLLLQLDPLAAGGRQVVIADRQTGKSKSYNVAAGMIRSWCWPPQETGMPWVLTVQPGTLTQLGSTTIKEIPALDEADAAMLSPTMDRAVGFYRRLPFLVDFAKPQVKRPITLSSGRGLGRMNVEWAVWSPNGQQVLMLLSSGPDKCDLYVGDPAGDLAMVSAPSGYRFSNNQDYAFHGPPWTAAWGSDLQTVYAVLIGTGGGQGARQTYAIGKSE